MRVWVQAIGAAVFLACLGAGAASAQTNQGEANYEDQVRSYLEAGMQTQTEHGYHPERGIPDLVRPMRLNEPHLWELNLRGGVNYRIYGACDDDCTDMDMEVYGADGELADRDIATNDTPYVQITPAQSGRVFVRMWVYACSNEPCYIAARVVSGGTPVERAADDTAQDGDGGAANDYETVVRSELEAAGAHQTAAGYAAFGDDVIVPIPLAGDGHRETVHLENGHAYLFQGACDQDCSDVDMEVLDPAGHQLAEDTATDDRPAVGVTPQQTGDYVVRIWLAQCTTEPCFVGIRGFRR